MVKRNPLWHTDHVRVQSLGHAYRLFCEHCGSEYVWALEPPIPIDVFIAGLNAWGKSHRDCRNRKLDEARAGLLSLLDHRGMQLYAQELDEGMAEFHARQDARNELLAVLIVRMLELSFPRVSGDSPRLAGGAG